MLPLIILFIFSACGSIEKVSIQKKVYEKDEQKVESSQISSEMSVDSIFPKSEGFLWYYEGPNDMEKVAMLENVEIKEDGRILSIKTCREDLSGTEELEDRMSKEIFEVTANEIIQEGSILLKAPIVVGNRWDTNYKIKPSGERIKATIEIIEVNDNTIKTKTIVSTEENIEEQYEEITIYKLGVGIVSQWYNIIGMDGFSQGLELKKTYEQPEVPEKWYLSPYAIELEKQNM